MAATIRVGSSVAEHQIAELSEAEIAALVEIYEVLRLTPNSGRRLGKGNMLVWDHAGLSVIYLVLGHTDEVVILRVDRLPA